MNLIDRFRQTFLLCSLVFPFLLAPIQCRTCPKECSSVTYTLASDYSPDCDHRENCIMKAKISVIQQGSMDEKLNLTLIGLNYRYSEDRVLTIRFESDYDAIEYSCSVYQYSGKTKASIIQGNKQAYYVGNVFNSSTKLFCNWILSKESFQWPRLANGSAANFINERNFRISLINNNISKVVAWDLSRFPLYKMKFLRCCYRVYGGPHYLLLTNQTNSVTNIYVQAFSPIPSFLTVKFRNNKGYSLTVNCGSSAFNASMKIGSKTSLVRDILYAEPYRAETPLADFRCSWSQPVIITERAGTFDTRDGQYSLEILSDMRPPYREPVIYLNSISRTIQVSSIIVLFSLIISLVVS